MEPEKKKERKENECQACGKFSYHLICGNCARCRRILNQSKKSKYKPRANICQNCGRPCAKRFCRACFQDKLDNPLWGKAKKLGPYIGDCRICFKEIRGKKGTYVPGLGIAHSACFKERERMSARVKELEGIQ